MSVAAINPSGSTLQRISTKQVIQLSKATIRLKAGDGVTSTKPSSVSQIKQNNADQFPNFTKACTMIDLSSRKNQMFPVLSVQQIETAKLFALGEPKSFRPGETVSRIGESNVPAWLVLSGTMEIDRHDGLASETTIVTHEVGHISGEVSQLSGRPGLAGARAGPDGCVAVAFDALHLKTLVIGSAEIGEIIMRAFILRRVALIDSGGAGSILIGVPGSRSLVRLQEFLTRSGYPYLVLDAASSAEGWPSLNVLAYHRLSCP